MSNEEKTKGQLPSIGQIGIVVKDIKKAAEFYTNIGLGPFHLMEAEAEFTYKGKPAPHKVKLGYSQGSPQIELIEPVSGDTPNSDFLKEKGEGISHFGFNIAPDDYDAVLETLAKEGVESVFSRDNADGRYCYVDADKTGGIMFELMCRLK